MRKELPALALLVWFLLAPLAGLAAEPSGGAKQMQQFLRLRLDDKKKPVALEAAIVRLASRDAGNGPLTVDLVSAVHVADKDYFDLLNREFHEYDAVLYELVAAEGTRVPKGGRQETGNPVALMQRLMKNVLNLKFQLEEIDYTQENLIHADMSPEQFADSMKKRGESALGILVRMMGYALARQSTAGGVTDLQVLLALLDKNRALALKRVLAREFADMDGSLTAIDGPKGSTLISERNKVALKVLGEQLAQGKQKIAIFYGAGHMPDFQQRLGDEFGLTPSGTRWLTAWDLTPPEPQAADESTAPAPKQLELEPSHPPAVAETPTP